MIKKEQLENKPLYSEWGAEWTSNYVHHVDLAGESINMFCGECKNNQTFNYNNVVFNEANILEKIKSPQSGFDRISHKDEIDGILTLKYICTHCHKFLRNFILKIYNNGKIEKVGQHPPLDIIIPKEIKSLDKKDIEIIYQRGKISENQGYGIGAFAYYRRVVELCIDDLIDELKEIIPEEKKKEYEDVVQKLKKEKIAENRINLIKDTIVDTSIDGNPLGKIYEISSIGIHDLSDEECLDYADSLRTLLIYVIDEISREKNKKDGLKKAINKIEKLISKSKTQQSPPTPTTKDKKNPNISARGQP